LKNSPNLVNNMNIFQVLVVRKKIFSADLHDKKIKKVRKMRKVFHTHTRQELSWYFLNRVMGSEGTPTTPATRGTTPNAQPNHGGRVLWKKPPFTSFGAQKVHYFGFLGAPIDFLDEHTFFGPTTNGFRGVRLLAILDLRHFL